MGSVSDSVVRHAHCPVMVVRWKPLVFPATILVATDASQEARLAATTAAGAKSGAQVAAAVDGGHGELFVQQFDGSSLAPWTELMNLPPGEAAASISAEHVVGPGAKVLVEARGSGTAESIWPSARNALRLPESLRAMPPKPIYVRAPDARARTAA